MASELIYTSSEKGLKPRTSGFCTVAMTESMAAPLAERLEGLSGYRPHFPSHDARAADNPVNYSYYRFTIGGMVYPVISRVCFAGIDYTGRSNKLAHHVVLTQNELVAAGPARLALERGWLLHSWDGPPRLIRQTKQVPVPPAVKGPARTWQSALGDAGWAGVVAEHLTGAADAVVAVIYEAPCAAEQLLAMIDEVARLLPAQERWDLTFSTYLTDLPLGTSCRIRCMLPDSAELAKLRRHPRVLTVDLRKGAQAVPATGTWVEAGRTGSASALRAPSAVGDRVFRSEAGDPYSMAPVPPPKPPLARPLQSAVHAPVPRSGRHGRWAVIASLCMCVAIIAAAVLFLLLPHERPPGATAGVVTADETTTASPTPSATIARNDQNKENAVIAAPAEPFPSADATAPATQAQPRGGAHTGADDLIVQRRQSPTPPDQPTTDRKPVVQPATRAGLSPRKPDTTLPQTFTIELNGAFFGGSTAVRHKNALYRLWEEVGSIGHLTLLADDNPMESLHLEGSPRALQINIATSGTYGAEGREWKVQLSDDGGVRYRLFARIGLRNDEDHWQLRFIDPKLEKSSFACYFLEGYTTDSLDRRAVVALIRDGLFEWYGRDGQPAMQFRFTLPDALDVKIKHAATEQVRKQEAYVSAQNEIQAVEKDLKRLGEKLVADAPKEKRKQVQEWVDNGACDGATGLPEPVYKPTLDCASNLRDLRRDLPKYQQDAQKADERVLQLQNLKESAEKELGIARGAPAMP